MLKKMLVIGAGGHGQVVGEIAEELGYEVSFLDDKAGNRIVGTISELDEYIDQYDDVVVGIGNNVMRQRITKRIESLGKTPATLIHPTSYISPSAVIDAGTVIEPKAIVNTNSVIEKGCIISVGSIVDHDVKVGAFAHINAGAICKGGAIIDSCKKLEAGEVVHGFN